MMSQSFANWLKTCLRSLYVLPPNPQPTCDFQSGTSHSEGSFSSNSFRRIGEFGASSEWNHAFIWDEQHGFRNLNTLVDAGAEWNLETALSINDRGEIVGIGDRGGTQDVGYLLVPEKGVPAKDTK